MVHCKFLLGLRIDNDSHKHISQHSCEYFYQHAALKASISILYVGESNIYNIYPIKLFIVDKTNDCSFVINDP